MGIFDKLFKSKNNNSFKATEEEKRGKDNLQIGREPQPQSLEQFISVLKGKDWLSIPSVPQSVDHLISALKYADSDIRKRSLLILGDIQEPRVIDHVIAALKDEDRRVRVVAVKLLMDLKDHRAIEPLTAALQDSDKLVRLGAKLALQMTDPNWTEEKDTQAVIETDSITRLRQYLEKYRHGFNTPGGFDTSDMQDYIKCIEEVGNLKNNEAITSLKEVQAYPCYAEIAITVEFVLRKIGEIKEKKADVVEKYVSVSDPASLSKWKDYQSQLFNRMNNLPISPDEFNDSWGDPIGECKIFKTIDAACAFVIDFLISAENKAHGFHNPRIESIGNKAIRAIFFHYKGGMEFFDSINVARISANEYIVQRK